MIAAIFMRRLTAKLWWENFIILGMVALLMPPIERMLTGDVSRYLPDFFSDGADGKDQIIYASIGATVFVPIMIACAIWLAVKSLFRSLSLRKS